MVKVLLLRFIRGQLDEASLRAALKAQRTSKLSKKKAKLKADKIVKALTAYLEATDGATSTSSFEGAVEALVEVATAEELEALIDHFHGKLRAQRLSEAEMIAEAFRSDGFSVEVKSWDVRGVRNWDVYVTELSSFEEAGRLARQLSEAGWTTEITVLPPFNELSGD